MKTAGSRIELLLLALAAAIFTAAPQLDLRFSGWFFHPGAGFYLAHEPWVMAVYRGVNIASWIAVGLLLGVLAFGWLPRLRIPRRLRRRAAFVLLCIALGPGLAVNGLLKEHWGRARPGQVAEFGGPARFTPALVPARECAHNCSFTAGHPSMGFALMSLAWVSRRRRLWLAGGLAAGAGIGFVRIVQGGHFLSDVVFSGFVVWFSIRLAAWLFTRGKLLK